MQNTNDNNGENKFANMPDVSGATVADKVVYYLASIYPDDKPRDTIIKECGLNRFSGYQTLCRLKRDGVLEQPARTRFKLLNLNQFKNNAKDSGHILTTMFRIRPRATPLPTEVVAAPLVEKVENFVDESNDEPKKHKPTVKSSSDEDRLNEFVNGFIQSIRTRLDRFEQDLEAQDY